MTANHTPHVRVGVGVFVFNSTGHFVMGKRKGSHGAGTWQLPGGHLEYGESFEGCAAREVLEETGLKVDFNSALFLTATNDIMAEEGKHYVTIFVACMLPDAALEREPEVMEPEKSEKWEWVKWEDLRRWAEAQIEGTGTSGDGVRKLFLPLLSLLKERPDIKPPFYPSWKDPSN